MKVDQGMWGMELVSRRRNLSKTILFRVRSNKNKTIYLFISVAEDPDQVDVLQVVFMSSCLRWNTVLWMLCSQLPLLAHETLITPTFKETILEGFEERIWDFFSQSLGS